jgi:hypothetical protein
MSPRAEQAQLPTDFGRLAALFFGRDFLVTEEERAEVAVAEAVEDKLGAAHRGDLTPQPDTEKHDLPWVAANGCALKSWLTETACLAFQGMPGAVDIGVRCGFANVTAWAK